MPIFPIFRSHSDYLEQWQKAMATGLMTGRPFSEHTMVNYVAYVSKFLERYQKVSFDHLKDHLSDIPIHQFSKKTQIHRAITSFAKFLISEKALSESFLEKAKTIKPRRHLPPKRLTVEQEGLSN